MIRLLIAVLFSELLATAGQISFKKSTYRLEPSNLKSPKAYLAFMKTVFQNPLIWRGFTLFGFGMVFWLMALAQGDLSFVYPLGSIQYLLILIACRIYLKEKIDSPRLLGTLLVGVGIVLIMVS